MALNVSDLPSPGDDAEVMGEQGYFTRAAKVRGGLEVTVTVPDEDEDVPVSLPQPVNMDAVRVTEEEAAVNEANAAQDKAEQEAINERGVGAREGIREAVKQRVSEANDANDDDEFDAGIHSHLIAAQVEREKAEESNEDNDGESREPAEANVDEGVAESERAAALRGVAASGPNVDEHGSNLATQDQRSQDSGVLARSDETADEEADEEDSEVR